MRSFKNTRSLKRNCKDVGHENCEGDTDPCRIIGKCDKELGYKWLEKLNIRISISLLKTLLENATRNSKDFEASFRVRE